MYNGNVPIDPHGFTVEVGGKSCTRLNMTMKRPIVCRKLANDDAIAKCLRLRMNERRMKNGSNIAR